MKNFKGFTFTELFLVLVILGILAVTTVPFLLNKVNNRQHVTLWRKVYDELSYATLLALDDNDGNFYGKFTSHQDIATQFQKHLTAAKVCTDAKNQECWSSAAWSWSSSTLPAIMLSNGASVLTILTSETCSYTGFGSNLNVCGNIMVDTNGTSEPNKIGKDIFNVYLLKDKVLPAGVEEDTSSPASACTSTSSESLGCSAKYLYNTFN